MAVAKVISMSLLRLDDERACVNQDRRDSLKNARFRSIETAARRRLCSDYWVATRLLSCSSRRDS